MGNGHGAFSALSAEERAAALVDVRTLARLESDAPADSTVWIGAGRIDRRPVLLALTDGHRRGGTIGIADAHRLAELTGAAATGAPAAIIVCWDTGGVRVEEGPVALAAASAVGVALARLSLTGTPLISVVSGPRGCFGAPSVMAALSQLVVMTEDARWGLTGPRLLRSGTEPVAEHAGLAATSAANRLKAGHTDVVVPDSPLAIREEIIAFLDRRGRRGNLLRAIDQSAVRLSALRKSIESERRRRTAPPSGRRRDLLRFSFRGHWRPAQPVLRRGLVHAAWGTLDGKPALGIIIGYEGARGAGVGIDEASAVVEMVRHAALASQDAPAPILTFLFCQGHAIDIAQERHGLQRALAECLRTMVAARLLGHPLLCVLGGGAYGAAYLAFAAPSHRVLAMKGTTVAPMAPKVLAAFRSLRGIREAPETPPDLAELIPEIRMVESVIRLPTALREELDGLLQSVQPAPRRARRSNRRSAPSQS
ncbi:MAG TPA: carboxyl transferase domain-containing protein [Candidatus Kryptonia bacterium]|nr:carboxyl transferase domain-containing protein [Candidatus Kryptonia bacterium]